MIPMCHFTVRFGDSIDFSAICLFLIPLTMGFNTSRSMFGQIRIRRERRASVSRNGLRNVAPAVVDVPDGVEQLVTGHVFQLTTSGAGFEGP